MTIHKTSMTAQDGAAVWAPRDLGDRTPRMVTLQSHNHSVECHRKQIEGLLDCMKDITERFHALRYHIEQQCPCDPFTEYDKNDCTEDGCKWHDVCACIYEQYRQEKEAAKTV